MPTALPSPPLRPWRPQDAAAIVRHADDYEVWRGLRDRFPHPYTPRDAEEWLSHVQASSPALDFAITEGDLAVGGIGLVPGTDIDRVSAEVGYWLGRGAWGRGLATSALLSITAYAFDVLRLERVFARHFEDNTASARVLRRAGYVQEAVLRRAAVKEGRVRDLVAYSTTRDDWRRREGA